MLLDSDEGKAAVVDLELLAAVAKHKATFFRSCWANYGTARSGTLWLMPAKAQIKDLGADYRAMLPPIVSSALLIQR
jgi:hypothetical protein